METTKPYTIDSAVTFEMDNFIKLHAKDVKNFQGRSFGSCLEYILERGKAEIERQVKTAKVRERQAASDQLITGLGLTLEQAQLILAEAQKAKQKAA